MIIFYIIIIGLIIWKANIILHQYTSDNLKVTIKLGGGEPSFPDYLSHNTTTCITGIFILIVFLRHVHGYFPNPTTPLDFAFFVCDTWLGQLLVTTFLFYSGYGVTISILRKGQAYTRRIPSSRILVVWMNFAIAVACYCILNLLLRTDISAITIFRSFLAWDSVGNSNWYIFVVLVCYLISYLSFRHSMKPAASLAIMWLLALTIMVVLSRLKPSWWSDTILCYPLGATCAIYRQRIDRHLSRLNPWVLAAFSFAACFIIYPYDSLTAGHGKLFLSIIGNLRAFPFILLVISLTRAALIGNPVLLWLGSNLFPLYIYQRIPMILFAWFINEVLHLEWSPILIYAYVSIAFASTLLLVLMYNRIKLTGNHPLIRRLSSSIP